MIIPTSTHNHAKYNKKIYLIAKRRYITSGKCTNEKITSNDSHKIKNEKANWNFFIRFIQLLNIGSSKAICKYIQG